MLKTSTKIPDSFRKLKATMTDEVLPRMVCNIDGEEKTGKSHFAFTAAELGPVANLHLDNRQEGVRGKFLNKAGYHPIGTYNLDLPVLAKQEAYLKLWNKWKEIYQESLLDDGVSSIMLDTGTDTYELSRLAAFGKLEKVPPLKYKEVNMAFKALIRRAFKSDKHLLILNKVKKHYAGDGGDAIKEWDGTYVRDGFTQAGYLVQVNIQTLKDYKEIKRDGRTVMIERNGKKVPKTRTVFGIAIVDCGLDPSLEGTELWEDDCTYKNLCSLVLGDAFD